MTMVNSGLKGLIAHICIHIFHRSTHRKQLSIDFTIDLGHVPPAFTFPIFVPPPPHPLFSSLSSWKIKSHYIFLAFTYFCPCLASPANFIYGWVEAKVLSQVTFMPMLLRPVNNFLGQVIRNASQGKYNTVNNSSSREVTFQKCLKSGIILFPSKNSNKSQTFATGAYQRLHEARPRRLVWLWDQSTSVQRTHIAVDQS